MCDNEWDFSVDIFSQWPQNECIRSFLAPWFSPKTLVHEGKQQLFAIWLRSQEHTFLFEATGTLANRRNIIWVLAIPGEKSYYKTTQWLWVALVADSREVGKDITCFQELHFRVSWREVRIAHVELPPVPFLLKQSAVSLLRYNGFRPLDTSFMTQLITRSNRYSASCTERDGHRGTGWRGVVDRRVRREH